MGCKTRLLKFCRVPIMHAMIQAGVMAIWEKLQKFFVFS